MAGLDTCVFRLPIKSTSTDAWSWQRSPSAYLESNICFLKHYIDHTTVESGNGNAYLKGKSAFLLSDIMPIEILYTI